MLNIPLRKKARQFSRLVGRSALTQRSGVSRPPVLTSNGEMGLTFIGHSGFFVQIGGKNIVIDGNFAPWLFVLKRIRRPGMRIKDLPPIDLVLITHAHFDHLDRPSLRAIARMTRARCGVAPKAIVPSHVGDLVRRLGFRDVFELKWWGSHAEDGLTVTHVPSKHWGARMIHDMHRGYGGYVLSSPNHSLYHAGDTAYFEGFREIGEQLRPEVALMPIGAYHPPSFRAVHASPHDAVRGFVEMGARWLIPMHYGTFRLSHEPPDEPVRLLRSAAESAGVGERVIVLEEGVTRFF